MVWKPHVTVAAVIERDGRYLLVEEATEDGLCYNQPAGHLECGESLLAAVVRETLEETAHVFTPEYLLGVYSWRHPQRDLTYLRFAYGGRVGEPLPDRALDAGIIAARWLLPAEIDAARTQHRSPLVWQGIVDHQAGRRFPLALVTDYHP